MDFDEIQMTESFGFRDSTYTRNSEKSSSPAKMSKYRCYSCGGNGQRSRNCDTCHKMKYVGENNPLVQLLGEIVNKKFGIKNPSFTPFEMPRESLKPQFSEIKEESELADDKIVICDECGKQGEIIDFKYCRECGHYYLCKECIKDGVEHDHPLATYCMSEEQSNEEMNQSNQKKICNMCGNEIEEMSVFLLCITCQDLKQDYKLCEPCFKKEKIEHSGHSFKPHLNRTNIQQRNSFWLDEGNHVGSSEIIEDDNQECFDLRMPVRRSNVRQSYRQSYRESYRQSQKQSQKEDDAVQFFDQSKIKLQIKKSENNFKSLLRRTESINQDYEQEQNYVFQDYSCDICDTTPQNYRYHCKKCQDYDLCEICYGKKRHLHNHQQFIKIGKKQHQKILEQEKMLKVDQVLGTILQLHAHPQKK